MTTLLRSTVVAAAFALLAVPRGAAQSSSIRVTISDGPHAGTYEMSEECQVQPHSYPALHIMAYETGLADPKTPRTMELFTASGEGKPDGFVVSVTFAGPLDGRDRYEIFAIPGELAPKGQALPLSGRGSVTVTRTATGTTATFRGQTKDGVRMEGAVDCRTRAS